MKHQAIPGGAAAPPLLEIEDVSVRFGGVQALGNVTLSVEAGEICGLIGPNGAGKTTLFNCVTRMCGITGGAIRFDGARIDTLPARDIIAAGVARTFQNLGVYPRMTVLENVMLGAHHIWGGATLDTLLRPRSTDRAERRMLDWCRDVLRELGLEAVAHELAGAMPYATLKRIELARALAARPRLLLLDEPAGGLTHGEVAEFGELVRRMRDRHQLTILLVEHHMGLVMSLCGRLAVLHLGRNLAQGTPAEIRAHPDVIGAYLGRAA
ncbi:ABC transporter ATP-binding protein [Pseudoduganella namucuonensis]|uniref:Amino acid/amide ABC transporter ATP-binding protein 1, HAAT family n=1 Tax=Pseudoduganella namucuonensis TaxID=1035707 RepID=A0A1I7LPC0_9BURK|nr:ABC transporter ATP-binding protein [Pseudoduganella namucuonensis]SFV11538.1 amino acid/amide ABC transporter ATP-binding protein 1, HAAT family [Pseudoduganella namucuonensis]